MFGGLGNQMFIYALGRVLMEKYEKKISFDTSSYKKDNFILEIEDLNAPYFQKTSNIYKIDFKFIKYLQIFPDFIKKILINFFSNGTIKDIEFEKNVDLANFGLRHLTVFNPEIFNKKREEERKEKSNFRRRKISNKRRKNGFKKKEGREGIK